jgi:hypothetical protein
VDHVVETVREVCSAAVNDGLQFDLAAVEGWRIKEDAEYEGVRVKVSAASTAPGFRRRSTSALATS